MKGRKLTAEEVTELQSKQNRQAGTSRLVKDGLYDSLVADFEVGEYGEIALGVDEKKPTVKKNITKAFTRRGLNLDWRRGKTDTLRFQVLDPNPAYGNGH